jgi:hypothetical protein
MSTQAVCERIGCTYRQLDYAVRSCADRSLWEHGVGNGSGSRRRWSPSQVIRLALAFHVASAFPTGAGRNQSSFPMLAAAFLAADSDDPPTSGYVVADGAATGVAWAGTWADVRRLVEDAPGPVVVAAYDLGALVGDLLDTTASSR